jgi:ribosomal protein S12 methylthiotransferase
MNVHLLSLGCAKNLADSERLLRAIRAAGAEYVPLPAQADVLMVNTCGFIEDAKRESIGEILNLAAMKSEGKHLVVLGCLTRRYRDEIVREIPEIDAAFGVGEDMQIVDFLKSLDASLKQGEVPPALTLSVDGVAPLKVSEGCNRRCTFCVIPAIRGRHESRDPNELNEEARAYVRAGVRELELVAQDLTAYYGGRKGYGIAELITDLARIEGDFWLRPLYLFPTAVDDALREVIAREDKVVDYIDVPLQHSEDRVLRAMGRPGSRKEYIRLINRARRIVPGAALRTSLIVGFPGETEEEFRRLVDFVEEARFDRLGAFMYSQEEGTQAASLPGQVSREVKQRRLAVLMRVQAEISLERNRALLGRRFRALVDEAPPGEGPVVGRIPTQARDVDGVTLIDSPDAAPCEFIDVEITGASEYDLEAVQV